MLAAKVTAASRADPVPVVHQDGQRDPGQLVAAHGKDLAQPQRPELGNAENVTESRFRIRALARGPGLHLC